MVLVFILCTIVILITLLICITILSTIRLEVDNFAMSNVNRTKAFVSKEYKLIISLYLFNKIKWLSFHLNDKRMRNMYSKMKLEKVDLKQLEKDVKFEDLKEIKNIKPKIAYLDVDLKLGVQDVIATSFIIAIISTLISVLLPYAMKRYKKDRYNYKIMPLYMNKNVYEIKFDCIIEVKIVHIINIIYVFLKKRRRKDERTSNRRSYGYSYE